MTASDPPSTNATRLAQPRAMEDLMLYRIARLLGTGGAPVIRLCEGRYGITRREWAVLGVLAGHPGLASSALAELARLDRARTSRALSSLVAKGLVQRTVRRGDRRQVSLCLTPQGQAVFDALFPQVTAINARLLAPLSPAELAVFDHVLDRLQHNADSLTGRWQAAQAAGELPKADRRRGGSRRERE